MIIDTKITNIGFDIDGTITPRPDYFAFLSMTMRSKGGNVYVLTSQFYTPKVKRKVIKEIKRLGVVFDEIYFTPNHDGDLSLCPHDELSIVEKIEWHKVWFCLEKGIEIFYDDKPIVVSLFQRYAPKIKVVLV